MCRDAFAEQLHDKATRGLLLSTEEQTLLDAWYAEHDRQEARAIDAVRASQRLTTLHTHVEAALAQLLTTTQHIQELIAQNQTLRQEITILQRQLPTAAPYEPV